MLDAAISTDSTRCDQIRTIPTKSCRDSVGAHCVQKRQLLKQLITDVNHCFSFGISGKGVSMCSRTVPGLQAPPEVPGRILQKQLGAVHVSFPGTHTVGYSSHVFGNLHCMSSWAQNRLLKASRTWDAAQALQKVAAELQPAPAGRHCSATQPQEYTRLRTGQAQGTHLHLKDSRRLHCCITLFPTSSTC